MQFRLKAVSGKTAAIASLAFAFLLVAGTAFASLTFSTTAITSDGALTLNPTGQPVTVNGNLTVTGTCTGCGGSGTPGGSNTQIQFNNAGNFGGSANLTWVSARNYIGVNDAAGVGDDTGFFEGFEPGLNNGTGNPTKALSLTSWDHTHGGANLSGLSDGTVPVVALYGSSDGSQLPQDSSVIYLGAISNTNNAFDQKNFFTISNDFTEDSPLHKWMLQLVEGNGVNQGGFPDSVPLFGLGTDSTTMPGGILDARNPITTSNLATNKARVVGLFEGRSDGQTGDLIQAKLTGGSPVFRVDPTGSVTATDIVTTPVTVSGLPTCNSGARGAHAFVTDANATTFNTTVAGGGSNNLPVFCDGTNWKIGG
jgi:hypothetical protein